MEVAEKYCKTQHLPNIQLLLQQPRLETKSEKEYENIEPWIQWVSIHTGLTAKEHGVFRLGDIVNSSAEQYFENVENLGYSVGAVSPMNTSNRLKAPCYFIPDPWTQTNPDASFWSRSLANALHQTVNDNASGKVTLQSLVTVALGLLRFARVHNYLTYLKLATGSRGRPWRKALFLDLFLHDLHLGLFKSKQPNFSTLFLNGGAHIQHHYFLNSQHCSRAGAENPPWYVKPGDDPMAEMFTVYDRIIGDYLRLESTDMILATGLSQIPYKKPQYYWRLKNHADFLHMLGIDFSTILPRMTRDFVITFATEEATRQAEDRLRSITIDGSELHIFGEIDNRGNNLFVTLTWHDDVTEETTIALDGKTFYLKPHVVFVAIKNGIHSPKGYVFLKGAICDEAPAKQCHVSAIHDTVLAYFGVKMVKQ